MTESAKLPRIDIRLALQGDLAEAFARFEATTGQGHVDAAKLALREYLTLSGYLRADKSEDSRDRR